MYLESPTTALLMILIYAVGGGAIALSLCVCLICCANMWSVLLYLKICPCKLSLCFLVRYVVVDTQKIN